ncbi:MAG: hypothetical protein J7K31_04365 [Candidatus Aenigmarchaeota archaeon]|nr:hypothetical protein [Candidatus Aenigmarchaeota archaeon]
MNIILDTNMLVSAIKFGVDIFGQIEKFGKPVLLDVCVDEIKKLAKEGNRNANLALQLIEKKHINIIDSNKKIGANNSVDKIILNVAHRNRWAVATNDKELIKKLRGVGIKVIRLRQKKYLIEAV